MDDNIEINILTCQEKNWFQLIKKNLKNIKFHLSAVYLHEQVYVQIQIFEFIAKLLSELQWGSLNNRSSDVLNSSFQNVNFYYRN